MDQLTIKTLIVHIKNGEKSSFRKLVEHYQSFAYRTAFRLLCNNYEAEEVTQEAFIKIWKYLSEFNTEMRFTTWLYKIVVNLCYDRLKALKVRSKYVLEIEATLLENLPSTDNTDQEIIAKDYSRILKHFTGLLTPKQRIVFVLSELEGLTCAEISEITGLTSGKIKSNLYCARQEVRKKLLEIDKRSLRHAI